MELVPIFDKNAVYIWAVYALATITLSATVLIAVRRARAAERLDRSQNHGDEAPK